MKDKSKRLAFFLRHDPNYNFPDGGWRQVWDLVKNHGFTRSELRDIVASDEKGRYEFSEDNKRIRARQGHSVNVDVKLEILTPPEILYHGTALRFLESIKKEGIKKMSRLYVHLSSDIETAKQVGKRHGKPIVLEINTKQMSEDGMIFRKSRNSVWLTEYIDPKYINFNNTTYD